MSESGRGCLVTGSPRSGTTLCASMIGAHPDVGMLSEHPGPGKTVLGAKVWGNKLCTPNQIALDPIRDDRSIWKRVEDGVRAVIGRPRMLPRFSESYPVPRRQYTIRTYVDQGACIVAMIRSPDHVVDSIRRRGHLSEDEGKHRWAQAIRTINQTVREYPDRTHLIRFMDLVNHPKATMRAVCEFVGLPYSKKMEKGYKYTPQYDNNQLDSSIATRDVESYGLKGFDPEAFEMYINLSDQAQQTLRAM